jgi:hypothetical protein
MAGCVNCDGGWIAFDDSMSGPGGVAPCPLCQPDRYVEDCRE